MVLSQYVHEKVDQEKLKDVIIHRSQELGGIVPDE
jgi:hypothetical protein